MHMYVDDKVSADLSPREHLLLADKFVEDKERQIQPFLGLASKRAADI